MTLRTIATLLTEVTNAMVSTATARVNQGAGNGTIRLYTGSPPATITGTPAGTLLATIEFQATAFAAPSAGSAQANGVPLSTSGLADGNIGWARVRDGDGNAIWDEDDVGTSGGNAITVNTVAVQTGQSVTLNGYTYVAAVD